MMESQSVSIIVPARNEHQNIAELVRRIPRFPGACEVIFIEGHSTDGTLDEIQRVAASAHGTVRWAVQDGIGKADAVWKGFAMAQYDILMILDADLTVAPEDLLEFYDAVVHRPGILANGSRLVYPMERGAMRRFNRVGNILFAGLLSLICGNRMTDTLCGTKVLMRSDFQRIKELPFFRRAGDPFGDFTLLLGAHAVGLPIVEVPVRYLRRRYGATKIRRWRHGWQLLTVAIRYYLA